MRTDVGISRSRSLVPVSGPGVNLDADGAIGPNENFRQRVRVSRYRAVALPFERVETRHSDAPVHTPSVYVTLVATDVLALDVAILLAANTCPTYTFHSTFLSTC